MSGYWSESQVHMARAIQGNLSKIIRSMIQLRHEADDDRHRYTMYGYQKDVKNSRHFIHQATTFDNATANGI